MHADDMPSWRKGECNTMKDEKTGDVDGQKWREIVRTHFPEWNVSSSCPEQPVQTAQLQCGQEITGVVVAQAPFGVWLDIGVGWPALLLVVDMKEAQIHRVPFEQYPSIGTTITGRIKVVGEAGELAITQREADEPMIPQ
jgi:transcriptional accessory protein Tex/SPT6